MIQIKTMNPLKALLLSGIFATCGFAQVASADWTINTQTSAIQFVSIKKDVIGEVHHFGQLSGTLTKTGVMSASIDLASVETGIDIRNSRMKEFLFEVVKFPIATVTATADTALIKSLKTGKPQSKKMPFELTLHGKKVILQADVIITKLKSNKISVTTGAPILLNAGDFGLQLGIDKLKELASLNAIASSIPVTFQIIFEPK